MPLYGTAPNRTFVRKGLIFMGAEDSAISSELSRKVLGNLSQRLARMPLDDIAKAIRKSDSTACRVRDGEQGLTVSEWVDLCISAKLKLVDIDKVCVDRAIYDGIAAVASKAMADPAIARQLVWDE